MVSDEINLLLLINCCIFVLNKTNNIMNTELKIIQVKVAGQRFPYLYGPFTEHEQVNIINRIKIDLAPEGCISDDVTITFDYNNELITASWDEGIASGIEWNMGSITVPYEINVTPLHVETPSRLETLTKYRFIENSY
jgi:hypothetical protein